MSLQDIFELEGDGGSLIFKKPYGEVHIPEEYIDHGISFIVGQEIQTFGLIDLYVYETEDHSDKPKIVEMVFPSIIRTCPSHIELQKGKDGNEYRLEYHLGSKFIKSTLITKHPDTARNMVDILFKGYIPDSLDYTEILLFWMQCNELNGVDLNVSSVILQTILSEFARDPDHLENPFRLALNDPKRKLNTKQRKLLRVQDLPRVSSTFASLSSADPKQGITVSVVRKRTGGLDNPSPIEEAIV